MFLAFVVVVVVPVEDFDLAQWTVIVTEFQAENSESGDRVGIWGFKTSLSRLQNAAELGLV